MPARHSSSPTAAASFTPPGALPERQWVAGTDPALWLGDLADPKNPRKFTGHGPGRISLALSRDGRLALTASDDKTLRLWDVETGKSRRVRREDEWPRPVSPSRPMSAMPRMSAATTIRLCDLKTGDELMTFRGHTGGRICGIAFCPDGRRIVSGGVDDHTIRVWNVETGEEIRQMEHGHGVTMRRRLPGRPPGLDGQLGLGRSASGTWRRASSSAGYAGDRG